MITMDHRGICRLLSMALVVGLLLTLIPAPAFSQQNNPSLDVQNLVANGGFEQGFQEQFGVALGWGGFSNGSALVGWNSETWDKVVVAGQYAQSIEIKNATERDRYAGVYQTIRVVPGQQYKLTVKGLIRSEEGSINASDYGYRLQYAIDFKGGTAWELVNSDSWQEIPWDEQPLYDSPGSTYRIDTFETTITATSDLLTLFIRGWKKWINNGSGIYNLDEISLIGPAPANFQAPVAQEVSAGNANAPNPADEVVKTDASAQETELEEAIAPEQSSVKAILEAEGTIKPLSSPQETETSLPVSGRGRDDSINYILIAGVVLLLALLGNAILATMRRRNPIE